MPASGGGKVRVTRSKDAVGMYHGNGVMWVKPGDVVEIAADAAKRLLRDHADEFTMEVIMKGGAAVVDLGSLDGDAVEADVAPAAEVQVDLDNDADKEAYDVLLSLPGVGVTSANKLWSADIHSLEQIVAPANRTALVSLLPNRYMASILKEARMRLDRRV